LYGSQAYSVKEITEMTDISKATLYRYLKNDSK
jgi:transposase